MKTMSTSRAGWAYAFIHFSVEIACFFFLFSRLRLSDYWWSYALIFDALAFIPQSAFGVLSDKFPNLPYGAIGCVMIAIALLLPLEGVGLIVLGIGNALAHIDGAQHTLRNSEGKITPNAVFVAGGSFGVVLGQLLGKEHIMALVYMLVVMMLLSAFVAYLVTAKHDTKLSEEKHIPLGITIDDHFSTVVLFTLIAVAARSFMAYAIPIDWNKTDLQAVALFFFMGFGKALGGVFADKIGYKKTTYLSLLLALPFLMFGNKLMWVSLFGVMLFSMTMPITVAVLLSKFPKAPGLAFGITTLGLFLGMFPKFFLEINGLWTHRILTAVLSCLALVCILYCLKKEKKDVI